MIPRTAIATIILALTPSGSALAGLNPGIKLPLHFKAVATANCGDFVPVDCVTTAPDVTAIPGTAAVFLLAYEHTSLAGVQTAFDFGGWDLMFGLWDCQVGQLSAVTPANPGGPTAGSITTAFTPVTTGELIAIGVMVFQIPQAGCLTQVQSSYPFGVHVIDALLQNDLIQSNHRLGRICVDGIGSFEPCFYFPAVEPATWGGIKAQYR